MTQKTLKGSEIVLKSLVDQGVDTIFGYPGGAVIPLYDALYQQDKIKHILVRHEQAALHAAEGYARSTGKVGVALVTSGPGATNAVTGLTDALMDSIPIVCISGQVPTHLIGNDAFQEADIVGITRPCTKHNYLVKNKEKLQKTMHEGFHVARSGRPGPVVIDIPKDVLQANIPYEPIQSPVNRKSYNPQTEPNQDSMDMMLDLIEKAKKPLLYCGGGVINAGREASEYLKEFAQITNIPVTLTLMGLGAVPASDPKFLGMMGMHGTYEANLAMHGCDLMIAVGSRFDDRVTGKVSAFSPNSTKIHIDIDPSSINKNVTVDLPIIGDCKNVLKKALDQWKSQKRSTNTPEIKKWWSQLEKWRSVDCLKYKKSDKVIKPQHAIEALWLKTKDKQPFISTEVGQHQMWAAQLYQFEQPNKWLTSGGLGTMGYGLPAAVGAQTANPDALVIDIAGEASIMMNIQELATVNQYRLPVKVFILNNEYLGMVRQWQQLFHESRYSETYNSSIPDFVKLAESFGAKGLRVSDPALLDETIDEMINTDGPVVVDVLVEKKENCYPMIPAGAAHNEIILGPEESPEKPKKEEGMVLI